MTQMDYVALQKKVQDNTPESASSDIALLEAARLMQIAITICGKKHVNLVIEISSYRKIITFIFVIVNGGWSEWSEWGNCEQCQLYGSSAVLEIYGCNAETNEKWIQHQTRECNNPEPEYGGSDCPSENGVSNTRVQVCQPINGNWGQFGDWSPCKEVNGQWIKEATRNCDNPAPKYGGECAPDSYGSKDTIIETCEAIEGGWGSFGEWSTCEKEDEGWFRRATRSCNNPPPKYGGECPPDEYGIDTIKEKCEPVEGTWGSFEDWSSCEEANGGWVKTATRECHGALYGGECPLGADEVGSTKTEICPAVNGEWGAFEDVSNCDERCIKEIRRECNNPAPQYNGNDCEGLSVSYKPCMDEPCVGCFKAEKTFQKTEGNFISSMPMELLENSVPKCQELCQKTENCKVFNVYFPTDGVKDPSCNLLNDVSEEVTSKGMSGPQFCPSKSRSNIYGLLLHLSLSV